MKKLFFILFMLLSFNLSANDGSYYIDGNQIIPMTETDISVKKEILDIKRNPNNERQVDVSVYYEFYNAGEPKTLTVGFEVHPPYGDVNVGSQNGEHPNMYHFTVNINGQKLPYRVSIVKDSLYFQNGKFKSLSQKEIEENTDEGWADYMYVYHFQANFKKGLNIIKHTYTCDLSGSVMEKYSFGYVLSAAMRWGNKQIDDFTLNIDMGKEQLIDIPQTFFDNTNEWTLAGIGRKSEIESHSYYEDDNGIRNPKLTSQFYIKNGYLIYQKQNFKPKGELYFSYPIGYTNLDNFDYRDTYLNPDIIFYQIYDGEKAKDDMSKKILRNLPFAKRGYVFSTSALQRYFEQQIWYFPDPSYKSDLSKLTLEEQKWVQYWSK